MSWTDIVTAATGSAGLSGAGIALALRRLKKSIEGIAQEANKPLADKVDRVIHDASNMRLSMATQFGGNGGGMRQAINELQRDVSELKGKLSVAMPVVAAAPHPTPGPQ